MWLGCRSVTIARIEGLRHGREAHANSTTDRTRDAHITSRRYDVGERARPVRPQHWR